MKILSRICLAFINILDMLKIPYKFSTNSKLVLYLYSRGLNRSTIRFVNENTEKNLIEYLKNEEKVEKMLRS